jgi:hypothetical protein
MAGSLLLNVEILGEFKKLTAATQGAKGQLESLNKTTSAISGGMIKALGAIGVGFSLGFIKQQFEEAAKAAIEDSKSMEILSIAMINTGKATKVQVAEAEESIRIMQLQNAVADDVLRPAFQKLFIATGDVTQSNKLLQVALDASTGTGKDLDSVTQAMAKSLAGQDTALLKLIPSLRGAEDPLKELEETFKGASEAAADLDPYQRMNIIFGEMQEQIGMALLPLLNEFSEWLTTPEGQAKLQEIVDGIVAIIEQLILAVEWVDENKDWLVPMVIAIGGVTTAWNLATAAVNTFKAAAGIAAIAGVSTAVGAGTVGTLGIAGAGAALGGYQQGQVVGQTANIYSGGTRYEEGNGLFGGAFGSGARSSTQNVTINVNKGNVTAQEIADAIRKANRVTGTNVLP